VTEPTYLIFDFDEHDWWYSTAWRRGSRRALTIFNASAIQLTSTTGIVRRGGAEIVERTGRAPMGGAMDVLIWAAVGLLFCAVLAVVTFGVETRDHEEDAP
jgi:hypothetical protein